MDGTGAARVISVNVLKWTNELSDEVIRAVHATMEGRCKPILVIPGQSERRRPRFRCLRRWLNTTGVVMIAAAFVAACGSPASITGRTDEQAGTSPSRADFAGTVDIGGGRKMYLECRGDGSPTVVLVSGLDAAADLWHRDEQPAPKVFSRVAEFTRVCAYDRPGTPHGAGLPSRSDPVTQPIAPKGAVEDLHALLRAAHVPGPYVLVGHSYGGLVTRLFASTYPEEVSGMILVDVLSDGLRDAMTPEEWTIWKVANARLREDIAEYPDLERTDYDVALGQIRDARPIRPMPIDQPRLVTDAIREVVDAVRHGDRALPG